MLTFIEACATIKSTIHAATDMVMRTIVMCSFYTCYKWALIKIAHLNSSFTLPFMLVTLYLLSEYFIFYISTVTTATSTQWLGTQTIKYGVLLKYSNKTHTVVRLTYYVQCYV